MNHPSKLTRLALLILAMPACGAFAAADYSALLDSTTTFSNNNVTPDTLSATGVTKVGTASDLNENHIGWADTPSQQVELVWTSAGAATAGTAVPLSIGGALEAATGVSSSYNSLSIDSVVLLNASVLNVGVGAVVGGSGTDAKLVDTHKLANGNVLSISGSGYQTIMPHQVSSGLNLTSATIPSIVGLYGNNNSVSLSDGALIAINQDLVIGSSDANNPTYGSNNSFSVSGSKSISIVGDTIVIPSSLTVTQDLIVGKWGSGNTVTVSGKASLIASGEPIVGEYGDNNKLSVSSSEFLTDSDLVVGRYPGADGNEVVLHEVNLNSGIGAIGDLRIGRYGSGNKLTVTDSTLYFDNCRIGEGDDDSAKDNLNDGTEGYIATEGCTNTASITNSKLHLSASTNAIWIGHSGSNNSLTIKDSSIYSAWADAGSTPDGKVQYDEITEIAAIEVGYGIYSVVDENHTSFGKNNALTLDNVVTKLSSLHAGVYGSNNAATLKNGTQVGITGTLLVGYGDDKDPLQGSSNTLLVTGSGTKIVSTGNIGLGYMGSSNKLSITNGATVTTGEIVQFGYGQESTSSENLSAYGSGNILEVSGKGSSLTVDNDLTVGTYGSNNEVILSDNATAVVDGEVHMGCFGAELGTVLNSNKVYSKGNKLTVASGASMMIDDNDGLFIGDDGIENSVTVTGENSYLQSPAIHIGTRSNNVTTCGAYNSMTVSDGAVVVGNFISIGANPDSAPTSNNMLTVDNAIVVATAYLLPFNYGTGENNILRIKNGTIALRNDEVEGIKWTDIYLDGYKMVNDSYGNPMDGISMVDKGSIEIWDASIGAYRKATKADISMKYYESEADAKAGTGYTGLAGYTVITQTNDLSRLAWAGDVYDGGNGSYCSSWYGWFYNDASYGDYIFSYNTYSWQYVDPDNTEQNVYLYDYALATWLYTNSTSFENKGFYNFATKEWMQIGK